MTQKMKKRLFRWAVYVVVGLAFFKWGNQIESFMHPFHSNPKFVAAWAVLALVVMLVNGIATRRRKAREARALLALQASAAAYPARHVRYEQTVIVRQQRGYYE